MSGDRGSGRQRVGVLLWQGASLQPWWLAPATGVAAIGTVLLAVAAQYADPLPGVIRGATWAYGVSVVLVALALALTAKLLPKSDQSA